MEYLSGVNESLAASYARLPPEALAAAGTCIALSSVLFLWILKRSKQPSTPLPPGDLPWPIGGLEYFTKGFSHICSYPGEGPRKTRLLHAPTVLLRSYDHIKMVLSGEGELAEAAWPWCTLKLLGAHSLLALRGGAHRAMRRLLSPFFTVQAVEGYLPAIQRLSERYVERWVAETEAAREGAAAEGAQPEGTSGVAGGAYRVDKLPKMLRELRQLTFEVMAQAVGGFDFAPAQLRSVCDAFDTWGRGLFVLVALPIPGTIFGRALAARKVLCAALDQQIDAFTAAAKADKPADKGKLDEAAEQQGATHGSATPPAPGRDGDSVLARLVGCRDEQGRPLSRSAMQDLAINLLFAGHETTAASLARALLALHEHPDVWRALAAEQAAAVAQHGGAITGAALRSMPYLDAVVKEVWRTSPIVPGIPRRALKDFTLSGYLVPKGWVLQVSLCEPVREHPAWRDLPAGDPMDPRAFNPDRWLADAGAGDGSVVGGAPGHLPPPMLVFGGGSRYCLGANLAWAEIKVLLAVLARRYTVSCPLPDMAVNGFPTLSVTDDMPAAVTARAQAAAAAAE